MTTEKTLEKIIEVSTALTAGDIKRAGDVLEAMAEQLRDDLRTAEAKKNGKTNVLSAAKRILKTALKTPRPALHKAFYNNGLQCVCDGFRGAQFFEPLPLEELPSDVETVNLNRLLDDAQKNNNTACELPELKALKTYIKLCKAEKQKDIFYDFGAGLPYVNAEFLADMLELFPDALAFFKPSQTIYNIYFESTSGRGLLCAVRPGPDHERKTTIL